MEIYEVFKLYYSHCRFQKCNGGLNLNTPSIHNCWKIIPDDLVSSYVLMLHVLQIIVSISRKQKLYTDNYPIKTSEETTKKHMGGASDTDSAIKMENEPQQDDQDLMDSKLSRGLPPLDGHEEGERKKKKKKKDKKKKHHDEGHDNHSANLSTEL